MNRYMGRTNKATISVDKLKVCLNQPQEVFQFIHDNLDETIEYDGFWLHKIECDEDSILCNVLIYDPQQEKRVKLGAFAFNNTKKYDGKAFFVFENASLYDIESVGYGGEKNNKIAHLYYICDCIGLDLNNITLVDLALDTNVNFIKKITAAVKSYDKYDMFLNRKPIISPDEHLEDYGTFYGRTRRKLDRIPTLYLAQAKKETGLSMRVYDKSRELDSQSPHKRNRLLKWLGWSVSKIYRIEITLHNTNVREFCSLQGQKMPEQGYLKNVLSYLGLPSWRAECFLSMCDRLLYFRDKATGEKLSIIDLADEC